MDAILSYVQSQQTALISTLKEMVECESPSDDVGAVNRFVDLLAAQASDLGKIKTFPGGRFARHLQIDFALPGRKKSGQVLVLGHSDTVWPLGTLKNMPFRQADGRLWGPGVLDMKAGLAFFLYAMRALRELDIPVKRKVVLQVNSDEETGSESSRPLTEKEARRSLAVLVLEPGTGLAGKLKTARKGVGRYEVTVRGIAAHAGVDFQAGASAIVELARQIERIASFTNLKKGITVNPGVVYGGTRSNVIAERAGAEIDVRVAKLRDFIALDKKFRSLRPTDRRCAIQVQGGLNRPPMEPNPGSRKLFAIAKRLAAELGVKLEQSSTGGGSDGNFTAALGVPTLDGLGAVGEGAHAWNECILIERMADRTALLAKLVAEL
ncbi:MAG: M20 family metallopeptidase [Bryobacteraceae bacterium]|nr:M20 family metallopeptidase [Bryobacteraceae bacterium]MDW8379626.1 M20 family metallopeptidase [Bryobacterales bacterium]